MEHELLVLPDPAAVASTAAARIAAAIFAAHAAGRSFELAVSGGHTPWAMFEELHDYHVPWQSVRIFQVDERVAPDGDDERNLTHLRAALGDARPHIVTIAVEAGNLQAAAATYARLLPERFDLVHLGLGPDGHTASLVPTDPVLEITDRLVAVTQPYQGYQRVTLTYPALARAKELLWLITGTEKADPLKRLLAGDRSIPAGRVQAAHSVVVADRAAAPDHPLTEAAQ